MEKEKSLRTLSIWARVISVSLLRQTRKPSAHRLYNGLMAQASKVGTILLIVFALPFVGGGVFFLYALTVSSQNFKPTNLAVSFVIASFFVFVGLGDAGGQRGRERADAARGGARSRLSVADQPGDPSAPWVR